jgi:predicted PurR-regulated permease PerM
LVGGLIIFGSSGLILGPLSVTITLLLLEIRHKPGKRNEPQMGADEH